MNIKFRVLICRMGSDGLFYLHCPTLGDRIGGFFSSEEHAREAASKVGLEVIDSDDLVDIGKVEINGHDLTHLAWWLKNCDFECVRTTFEELVYYEAQMERSLTQEADLLWLSMSTSASIALENLAKDLNQWAPSYAWANLARRKLEKLLSEGAGEVTCDLGTVSLANLPEISHQKDV